MQTPFVKNAVANFFFFANRTLALKKTLNSTKHPKKNKDYNEILRNPPSSTSRPCRRRAAAAVLSLSWPDVVSCGRKVAERVKKTTSVPKTKKKEELPMKLLDDPKIPTARRNPRKPYHSHKPLDVAAEIGLKPGRPYCMGVTTTTLAPPLQTLILNTKNRALKTRDGVLSPTRPEIHHASIA
jgi:hypothetical protein